MALGKQSFVDVVLAETSAVNERRRLLARRWGEAPTLVRLHDTGKEDERGEAKVQPDLGSDLVGLCLSGGGVRSAAFCLGVLQGLDSVTAKDTPQILDAVDYLSTVSGGGYMGASLAAGMTQQAGLFPFSSKLDDAETLPVQHLRDFSNYLAPNGLVDILAGIVALARGLLLNATILLSMMLFGAAITVALNPSECDLRHSHPAFSIGGHTTIFGWTILLSGAFGLIQFVYAIVANRPRRGRRTVLRQRESASTVFVWLLLACGTVVVLELQAFVLAGLFDAAHLPPGAIAGPEVGWLGRLLHRYAAQFPTLGALAMAIVGAFGAFGSKFLKVAQATLGDKTWSGFLKHWGSRLAIYLGGVVVPLALWAGYLSFAYAGIRWGPPGSPGPLGPNTPDWLAALADRSVGQDHIGLLYLLLFLGLFAVSLLITPNASSLHNFYRDRLSRAFIWSPGELAREARRRSEHPDRLWHTLLQLRAPPRGTGDVDRFKLSALKPMTPAMGDERQSQSWTEAVAYAPYLLVNTAVNLEASAYLNRRGRNADSFFFSALFTGSEATGFVDTRELETCDSHIDLATAMSVSGAAASANMGASTIKPLTFSLAILNIRLGYWLPNPRRLDAFQGWRRVLTQIGPWYFTKEALGQLDEWTRNVYLTDGGHFDNLGLYELLKRRCKIIIAADAEADPPMNFESLIRLQRYARIDLGVRIDLPWEDLRRFSRRITIDQPHGPHDDPGDCIGPHIALGKIDYGNGETGVLIYVKSCISGDENDLIRDYRRRNNDFPHETTLDQFFTEEQFEVYRALGFHATQSFFKGKDRFAYLPLAGPDDPWAGTVETALKRLHVPDDAIGRICRRQNGASGGGAPLSWSP